MTFEEFFAKKKIDLGALAEAQPELFSEFKSHYAQMGEKSFDHTKKFWFNKLRRLYHLATPEKAVTQLETSIASQAEPLSSPTIEQKPAPSTEEGQAAAKPAVRPAFKPRNIPVKQEEKKDDETTGATEQNAQPAIKKPGFKPRNFKPADQEAEDAKSVDSRPGKTEHSATPLSDQSAADNVEKPAYKPKFNMRNITKNPQGEEIEASDNNATPEKTSEETAPEAIAKPAYKPKFNLKNVQKAKDESLDLPDLQKETGTKAEGELDEPSTSSKPAYKPRFNMRNVPAQTQAEPEQAGTSANVEENQDAEAVKRAATEDESVTKPTYKPRFNMKDLPKLKQEENAENNPPQRLDEHVQAVNKLEDEAKFTEERNSEPKPAYKPRFNMKNVKLKSENSAENVQSENLSDANADKPINEEAADQQEVEPTAKPAYKPKFNMRNIKPNSPEE